MLNQKAKCLSNNGICGTSGHGGLTLRRARTLEPSGVFPIRGYRDAPEALARSTNGGKVAVTDAFPDRPRGEAQPLGDLGDRQKVVRLIGCVGHFQLPPVPPLPVRPKGKVMVRSNLSWEIERSPFLCRKGCVEGGVHENARPGDDRDGRGAACAAANDL